MCSINALIFYRARSPLLQEYVGNCVARVIFFFLLRERKRKCLFWMHHRPTSNHHQGAACCWCRRFTFWETNTESPRPHGYVIVEFCLNVLGETYLDTILTVCLLSCLFFKRRCHVPLSKNYIVIVTNVNYDQYYINETQIVHNWITLIKGTFTFWGM